MKAAALPQREGVVLYEAIQAAIVALEYFDRPLADLVAGAAARGVAGVLEPVGDVVVPVPSGSAVRAAFVLSPALELSGVRP